MINGRLDCGEAPGGRATQVHRSTPSPSTHFCGAPSSNATPLGSVAAQVGRVEGVLKTTVSSCPESEKARALGQGLAAEHVAAGFDRPVVPSQNVALSLPSTVPSIVPSSVDPSNTEPSTCVPVSME